MKRLPAPGVASRPAQRGVAAIELAGIMIFCFLMLPAVLLFARVFLYYSVFKSATDSAASYMASLPRAAIKDSAERARHEAIARRIITEAGAAAGLSSTILVEETSIFCGDSGCADAKQFGVLVTFRLSDPYLNHYTNEWTTDAGRTWKVTATSVVPLVN